MLPEAVSGRYSVISNSGCADTNKTKLVFRAVCSEMWWCWNSQRVSGREKQEGWELKAFLGSVAG